MFVYIYIAAVVVIKKKEHTNTPRGVENSNGKKENRERKRPSNSTRV